MKPKELRYKFKSETGTNWENSQGEPDIDYVIWLEDKLCFPSLPTDEEIEKNILYENPISAYQMAKNDGFMCGAKWLRDTYYPQVDLEKCHNGGYIKINRTCYEKKGECIERKCQFFSTCKADKLISKVQEAWTPDTRNFEEAEKWEKLKKEFYSTFLTTWNIDEIFNWFMNKLK